MEPCAAYDAVAQVDALGDAARQVLEGPADAPRVQLLVAAVQLGERLLHEAERPGARLLGGGVRGLLRLDLGCHSTLYVSNARGWYAYPVRTVRGALGQAALCVRYVPNAGGWYA